MLGTASCPSSRSRPRSSPSSSRRPSSRKFLRRRSSCLRHICCVRRPTSVALRAGLPVVHRPSRVREGISSTSRFKTLFALRRGVWIALGRSRTGAINLDRNSDTGPAYPDRDRRATPLRRQRVRAQSRSHADMDTFHTPVILITWFPFFRFSISLSIA